MPRNDAPLYQKDIVYDRKSHDYACYLDGELVWSAHTYHEAEVELDRLVLELIGFVAGWDATSEVTG